LGKTRVLVAACEGSHRRTLAAFLEGRGHDVVVTSSGREAVAIAQLDSIDLVVTGPTMPGICGYELTRTLRELVPELPVILMSAGADTLDGVMLDSADTLGVLRTESGGARRDAKEPANLNAQRLEKLSRRERQVLDLIASGHANKMVAWLLSISPRTVEHHRAQVMRKTQSRSIADLVRLVLSDGEAGDREAMRFDTEHGAMVPAN
jgi:two-component system response regulator FixJ